MNKIQVVNKTAAYAKKTLSGESSGHDWWHVKRVWETSKRIGKKEKADMFVVELAALLHDIADYKLNGGNEEIGPKTAAVWLKSLGVDRETIEHITRIIRDLSFKGAKVKTEMETIEGEVVQDADRLDALGAIGIARTFAYGGKMGREIYDPGTRAKLHKSFKEYKNSNGPTINHFYEKLLLLKARMNTKTAKKMAGERDKFMRDFLKRFYKEWEGRV